MYGQRPAEICYRIIACSYSNDTHPNNARPCFAEFILGNMKICVFGILLTKHWMFGLVRLWHCAVKTCEIIAFITPFTIILYWCSAPSLIQHVTIKVLVSSKCCSRHVDMGTILEEIIDINNVRVVCKPRSVSNRVSVAFINLSLGIFQWSRLLRTRKTWTGYPCEQTHNAVPGCIRM